MRLGCLFEDQDDDDGHGGPLNPNKTLEQIVEGKWKKPMNDSTMIRSSFKRRCALD